MKNSITIEIGKSFLKIGVLAFSFKKASGGFFCITKFIASLDDTQVSKLLSNEFAKLKLKSGFLSLSLPRNLITVRILSLPSRVKEEIFKMVDLHMVRVVPYKKEEVTTCFSILDTNAMGFTKVLLCVAHKDIVKRYFRILTNANLSVDKIYMTSYGVWESILSKYKGEISPDKVYFGLDIGFDYADFIAFSKKYMLFTRNIAITSKQLSEQSGREKLIKEIKQTRIIFRSEYENIRPAKIFISGAIGNLKELSTDFEKQLEMPVTFLPLKQALISLKDRQAKIDEGVSVTSLRELALDNPKRISLYIPELQVRKALREKTKDLIIAGPLFIYVFFIIWGLFLGRMYNRQHYLSKLQTRLESIHQDIGGLVKESKRIQSVKEVLKARNVPLFFFQEIYSLLPEKAAFKEIVIEASRKVILRGEAKSLADVFIFVNVLETSKWFKDIETGYTRTRKTSTGEHTSFELILAFVD